MPDAAAGPVVYVLAEPPTLSQTFILGEMQELLAQGEDVRVLALRQPAADALRQPGSDTLATRTHVLHAGRGRQLACLLSALGRRPGGTLQALWWATRWSLRTRRGNELVRLLRVAALLPHLPHDTRHLHAHFAHGPASAALLLSYLSGVPFSFTAHARDMGELSTPAMLREKVRAAAFVVAISEHGQRELTALVPDCRDRIHLVRNGIDISSFAPPADAMPAADRPPLILAVGRLVPKKGFDLLVDACRLLRADGLDVECEIVGGGRLAAELRERAVDAGVADLVRFSGELAQPAVIARLAAASVFALPCRVDEAGDQDGLPVSIVEAMAAGLPVVSCPVAGVPEVVHDGFDGLLVPVDDAPALADALRRLLTSRPLRARLSAGAAQTAATYDRRVWVSCLRGLFPVTGVSPARDEASSLGSVKVSSG